MGHYWREYGMWVPFSFKSTTMFSFCFTLTSPFLLFEFNPQVMRCIWHLSRKYFYSVYCIVEMWKVRSLQARFDVFLWPCCKRWQAEVYLNFEPERELDPENFERQKFTICIFMYHFVRCCYFWCYNSCEQMNFLSSEYLSLLSSTFYRKRVESDSPKSLLWIVFSRLRMHIVAWHLFYSIML